MKSAFTFRETMLKEVQLVREADIRCQRSDSLKIQDTSAHNTLSRGFIWPWAYFFRNWSFCSHCFLFLEVLL